MEIYAQHYADIIDNSTAFGNLVISDNSVDGQRYRSSAFIKK